MKTKSMTIWMMVLVLCLTSPKAIGWVQFKDGGTHDIYFEIPDHVWVDFQAPGMETTLNFFDGGGLRYKYDLEGHEDSIINIFGGTIRGDLYTYDRSQITMSGGKISYHLYAWDNSQVTISGGSMGSLYAQNNNQIDISGGNIGYGLYAQGSSQVNISGGTVRYGLHGNDSSQVNISDGLLSYLFVGDNSQVNISGGEIENLYQQHLRLSDNALVTIHGWNFAVDGTLVSYTELYSIFGNDFRDEPYRQLTGTLLSGDLINDGFRIGNNAKIVLVPEPATLLLLGLGAVMVRRKR